MNDTARWADLARPIPEWFQTGSLGIFIHWGPYSVPAWAEPTAELGTVEDDRTWFTHNPYAEWYANTIAIDGSPAQRHHQETYDGAHYDDFLDAWTAERFDPDELLALIAGTGADYVVPTTKHHDGIALWDAPGTGTRNTVRRGPRRDLIGEIHQAAVRHGLRFGVYYSGGLDWHVVPTTPHLSHESFHGPHRPNSAEYASYVASHIRDLVRRYDPAVLWNDIQWPEAGKTFGPDGLGTLFEEYYATRPDGVVNDRWRASHHDFATSEYQRGKGVETEAVWENTRGIGLSFGYNRAEGPEHSLTGPQVARHLADVVSRGGRLLLNVGPRADGTLPEIQRQVLESLGRWMHVAKHYLDGSRPEQLPPVLDGHRGWARTIRAADGSRICFVDLDEKSGSVLLSGAVLGDLEAIEPEWATVRSAGAGVLAVDLAAGRPGPAVLRATLE